MTVEGEGEPAPTPKRRTVKPKEPSAKAAAKTAAPTTAKPRVRKKVVQPDAAEEPAAIAAPEETPAPAAKAAPIVEPAPQSDPPPAPPVPPEPAPVAAAPEAVQPPAPAPAPMAPRQYPVYIPRHIAKQLEESGQPAPVAVTAEIAASMPIVAAAAAAAASVSTAQQQHRREPRPDRRGQRDDRRGSHEDRRGETQVMDAPPEPSQVQVEVVSEEEMGLGEGIVEISGKGFGFLRDPKKGYTQNPSDIFVTPEIARGYNLRDGQWIKGHTRRGNRGAQLYKLVEVNGEDPERSREQPAFDELTVVSPLEKFTLETVPDRHTTRIIDLMAPIGKGQRGLIVAPPRTGKTTLLQHIADAVVKNHPETKLIILLVDERPEEVTDIKRTVPSAEIMASSNDMDVKSHTRIAQLAIERAKRLCEAGQDVFILLDSITRVGRAFNNAMSGGGRTMSGGVDARALEIPRRIFAAARNSEEAGSITIVATALIDTGSRMDDLIFQEFKGTGNMELVLDRKISDQRIYPAIDIFLSGTRREELLIPADDLHKIGVIRRGLSGYKPIEAIERLIFFMKKFPTNSEMLKNIPG